MSNPVAMIRHVTDGDIKYDALMFVCPGCVGEDDHGSGLHMLAVTDTQGKRPNWKWDGNLEFPTLEPSIMTKWADVVCHSFLRVGIFEYLGDCTHKYANQMVPLPPLPDWIIHERHDPEC